MMDVGSWIALIGAAVAAGGAAVATWQGASARSQAMTSKDSAASAWRAANAAEAQAQEAQRQATAAEDQVAEARRSAAAAEEQVQLMRRQLDDCRAERDEREGPVFSCKADGLTRSICTIVVTMTSGREELSVRVAEVRVRPTDHDPDDRGSQLPDDNRQYRVVPNGSFTVQVDLQADSGPVVVELRLECTELGEQARSWTRRRFVPVPAPPPPPMIAWGAVQSSPGDGRQHCCSPAEAQGAKIYGWPATIVTNGTLMARQRRRTQDRENRPLTCVDA